MVRTSSVWLSVLIAVIASAAMTTTASAEKTPTPEEFLESRGLTREGKYFVVRAEKKALQEFVPVVARSREMSDSWDVYAEMFGRANLVKELEAEQIDTNSQISRAQFLRSNLPNNNLVETRQARAELDQNLQALRGYAGQVAGRLALARQQAPSVGDLKVGWNKYTESKDAFLESCKMVQPTIGQAMGEYDTLKNDPDVQNALGVMARRMKLAGTLKVGPSDNFKTAVRQMNEFKKMVSREANVRLKSVKPKKPGKK